MKRTALKRKPWRKALGNPALWAQFKFAVAQADDFTCVMVGQSACDGPLQAAHVIPKSRLRRWGYEAEVVYSVDAAMTLCFRHHNRFDRALEDVPPALWPGRCREFAAGIIEERRALSPAIGMEP